MYPKVLKRLLDIIFSLFGLIFLLPVFLLITIVLFVLHGGKPFFTQLRTGKNERPFKLYKFRTMNDKRDNEGKLLPDKYRITSFGKLLRSSSLDEIPQLFNVLRGDMSLVGPRPLLTDYLPFYNNIQRNRHLVRPGITGWAQVNGRNSLSWDKKFQYDIWYVEHLTFGLDARIIWLSLIMVLTTRNINYSDQETMTRFDRL